MLDNITQVDRLCSRMEAALPLTARISSDLAEVFRREAEVERIPATCQVVGVSYAGDPGGIMCQLDLGPEVEQALYVSITHLSFGARSPLAREVAAYQKHRNKRIRRQVPPASMLPA